MIEQSQSVYVSVAHRYWNPRWDEARNRRAYGRNASSEGVGSNLKITATAQGQGTLDLTAALKTLKDLVDHKCFFTDFPEFTAKPSTLEAITVFLAAKLFAQPLTGGAQWSSITVHENDYISATARPNERALKLTERVHNLLCTVEGPMDPDDGVVLERGLLAAAVNKIAPQFAENQGEDKQAWGRRLFGALATEVKALRELDIDLGSHQRLRITSNT